MKNLMALFLISFISCFNPSFDYQCIKEKIQTIQNKSGGVVSVSGDNYIFGVNDDDSKKTEAFNTKSEKAIGEVAKKAVENSPVLVSCSSTVNNLCTTPTPTLTLKPLVFITPTPKSPPEVSPVPTAILTETPKPTLSPTPTPTIEISPIPLPTILLKRRPPFPKYCSDINCLHVSCEEVGEGGGFDITNCCCGSEPIY